MKKPLLVGALMLTLLLVACVERSTEPQETMSIEELPPAEEETHNVRYQGTLEDAGISLYMEGSHRLVLANGSFIFLQSDDVDLDYYVGADVEVAGNVRPTVEEGGRIMKVLSLVVLSDASSSSSGSEESSSASSIVSSAAASSVASVASVAASSAKSISPVASSAAASSVQAEIDPSSQMGARTAAMTNVNMDVSLWTRRYCSTHIGFCFPVHKNWWYKSFGVTTSSRWHVEVSSEEIFNLGDGPVVVTLLSGSHASAEPTFASRDGFFFANVAWTDGNHFEVHAPEVLRSSVEFIARNITPLATSSVSSL